MASPSLSTLSRIFAAEQTLVNGRFAPEIAVVAENGRISRVCPLAELAAETTIERFPRRLLAPGTLNAHNHSFQSMLRGIADDCDFFTWRDKALYAYTPRMNEETVYAGALFAFAEMIRAGVTTVCDFFYIHRDGNANDHAVIRAAQDLGLRIVLARTMYDWEGAPVEYRETIADASTRTRELWQAYRGRDDVPRIPDMLRAGVKIGLGSDGGCSNNRVSVFDEMRTCALLQKVTHLSSEVVPAETAFAMGTSGSAEALGLPAGSIEAGRYADFVLLGIGDPSLQPPLCDQQ